MPGSSNGRSAGASASLLVVLADSLDDVEALRTATANQLHSLTREADDKGGKGLSPDHVAAVMLAERLAVLEQFEHQTVLELRRALRAHPLGPWVKRTVGIGEKQGARLIAAIGDPAWNGAENRPRRGPAELWAYCGYAPGQRRRKGVRSNWNAEAKARAFLCAEKARIAGVRKLPGLDDDTAGYNVAAREAITPLGEVYLKARANWESHECAGCKGPCSDSHKDRHALRCVAKEILKDLWRETQAISCADPMVLAPASPSQAPREAA